MSEVSTFHELLDISNHISFQSRAKYFVWFHLFTQLSFSHSILWEHWLGTSVNQLPFGVIFPKGGGRNSALGDPGSPQRGHKKIEQ